MDVYWIFSKLLSWSVLLASLTTADLFGRKIFNGQNAGRNEFPWVGYVKNVGDESAHCGAILVAPMWVLTSGVCAQGLLRDSVAVFGDYDLTTSRDKEVSVPIMKTVFHPRFRRDTFSYNIALLELKQPGYIPHMGTQKIQLVPNIADKRIQRKVLKKDITCTATGYGIDVEPDTGFWRDSTNLKKIMVRYVTDDVCKATGIPLALNTICQGAIQDLGGSCYGDEGSATMCEVNGKIYMVSMLSYFNRLDGCRVGYRQELEMAPFLGWINRIASK